MPDVPSRVNRRGASQMTPCGRLPCAVLASADSSIYVACVEAHRTRVFHDLAAAHQMRRRLHHDLGVVVNPLKKCLRRQAQGRGRASGRIDAQSAPPPARAVG